jgi:hypothetical protein
MSDIILFNAVPLGDRGRLLVPQVEALGRGAEPMLWATFADLDDASRNWVYRLRAAVVVERNADWKLMQYLGSLRAALGGLKADLVWATGSVTRITWPDARLDAIRPSLPDDRRAAGLDANLILEFTSASDPVTEPE